MNSTSVWILEMLPEKVPERFWEELAGAPRGVLLLDYDGTLAPFHVDRNQAFPYDGVRDVLETIMRGTDTRVVVVSGRWTRDLVRLLDVSPRPEMFGSHGLERLFPDGSYEILHLEEGVIRGLAEIDAMAIQDGLEERIERKPGCLALHWRGLEPRDVEELRKIVEDQWREVAEGSGLMVTRFNGGMEIRAPDRNKGDVVRIILGEEEEGAVAAYLGDDRTDEDAFKAIGKKGLGILVSPEDRTTSAAVRLTPPEDVLAFLRRWGKARRRNGG